MLSNMAIEEYQDYYSSLSTADLLRLVTGEIRTYLADREQPVPKEDLQRHFLAAHALLDRVDVVHSYHTAEGEHMYTPSGESIANSEEAFEMLRDMDLTDGDVVAYLKIGRYIAARKKPEIALF